MYLKTFTFPNREQQELFLQGIRKTCYDSFYPFGIMMEDGGFQMHCEPITILYGDNGSGKTTALNIMAEQLKAHRKTAFNRSAFFDDYVGMCEAMVGEEVPCQVQYIASDDVFDYMLDIRNLNDGIDQKREELFGEYLQTKYAHFQMKSLADYEALKKVRATRTQSQSQFVRGRLMDNVKEQSNGESAFMYFTEQIDDNGLYFLDEPENSLSPKRQIQLVHFLEDAARFFGCQFIISTHSPFILAMKGAKIYDLDSHPIVEKKWTLLDNVRYYYDFFRLHAQEFD